jgi:hypothetical protein
LGFSSLSQLISLLGPIWVAPLSSLQMAYYLLY